MALNLPQVPFKLTPQDMGNFNLGDSIKGGLGINKAFQEARVMPEMLHAQIDQMKGAAQKNLMMSKLFESLIGSNGGLGEQVNGAQSNQSSAQPNNLKAAVLKAFTGIDPFLMSPQQQQDLKISGATKQLASKKNIETGGSNVVREQLQNKVSFPEEYITTGGHLNMLKDIMAAKLGDKKAKERLIKAATANKLVPEYAASQLAAIGQQKPGVTATQHQIDVIKQGWPSYANKIISNLPGDIQKEAEKRHNQAVKDISKKRSEYYKSNGEQQDSIDENISPPEGAAIVLMKNGKPHMIPADKVEDAIKNWGYSYE